MSDVFFTSDLHIGHEKVARIRAEEMALDEVDIDVFMRLGLHDILLAEAWDRTVDEDDTVWVLGDISSGSTGGQRAALEWVMERPGHKHLIIGNHDGVHPMYRDSHKWFDAYCRAFDSVQLGARRRIPLREGHVDALLSHFPYTGDHKAVDRHPQWRLPDLGEYLLHGHVHSLEQLTHGGANWDTAQRPNQIHVGPDAWNLEPVSLETIREMVIELEDSK